MYRVFCESYRNYINSFKEDSYRLRIAKIFELLVDGEKYNVEKNNDTINYKKICELLFYMNENIKKYPKFKAFLWTLSSRNINPKKYDISNEEELEEQAKLMNSFLKLAYWY